MSVKNKYWKILPNRMNLNQETFSSFLSSQLLANRNLRTAEEIKNFVNCTISDLNDPFAMLDMERAVNRIITGINEREKILIYGDYDVDGITSTVILYTVLEKLGGNVGYYIPNRHTEGYGLNENALIWAAQSGYQLIITVDCGISALKETDLAFDLGIELIITDHHEVGEIIPKAEAVLNPKRPDCNYPFKQLAGVGVAYKLAQALWITSGNSEVFLEGMLSLVALGTVADVVPLLNENRIFVKYGLEQMNKLEINPGLKRLLELAGFSGERIDCYELSFLLAPRINAIGRLDDAKWAVQLLLEKDEKIIRSLAEKLNRANQKRQQIEKMLLEQAEEQIFEQHRDNDKVFVITGYNWNPGVIGIVASRLVEKYYRPVIIISLDEQLGKGSGRSIDGFNLYRALSYCSDLLVGFGGHSAAGGLTIEENRIEEFRARINKYAKDIWDSIEVYPELVIDLKLEAADLDFSLIEQLERLEPFGCANPEPLFLIKSLIVQNYFRMGTNSEHLKLFLINGSVVLQGVFFRGGDVAEKLKPGCRISVVFRLSVNDWNGKKSLQLLVEDLEIHEDFSPFPVYNKKLKGNFDKLAPIQSSGLNFNLVLGEKQKKIVELIYSQSKPVLGVVRSKYYAHALLNKRIASLGFWGIKIAVSCPFLAGNYYLPFNDAFQLNNELIVISWEMMEQVLCSENQYNNKIGGIVEIDSEVGTVPDFSSWEKIKTVEQLLGKSKKCILVVNSNWADKMNKQTITRMGIPVWVYRTSELTSLQRLNMLTEFFYSKTGVMIIDLFSASELDYLNYEGNVFFLDPCLTPFECSLAEKIEKKIKKNPYMLTDSLVNKRLNYCLKERILTPDILRELYKCLYWVSKRSLTWNSREEFAQVLSQAMENKVSSFSVFLGLAIFTELGLMNCEQRAGKYIFNLKHKPGIKVNLEDSTVYWGILREKTNIETMNK